MFDFTFVLLFTFKFELIIRSPIRRELWFTSKVWIEVLLLVLLTNK